MKRSIYALSLLAASTTAFADGDIVANYGVGDGVYKGIEFRMGGRHVFGGFDFGKWESTDGTLDSGMSGLFLGLRTGDGPLRLDVAGHMYAESIDDTKSFGEATSSLNPWAISSSIQGNMGALTVRATVKYLNTSDTIVRHAEIGTRTIYMLGVGVNF